MKITDFVFRFKTYGFASEASLCRVRIFTNKESKIHIVLTDLSEEARSTSVTNALELILEQLTELQKIPQNAQIIEHYPRPFEREEKFSMVSFDEDERPIWRSISFAKILKILDCEESEFDLYKNDERVMKEIYDALNGIPAIEQFEYSENPEITQSRLEIKLNQHSKHEFKALLDKNPTERELAEFLKEDLSLLGEFYAYSPEEYVCFCEFPVGSGRVDFAVFTGRSRMNVYLIEIKGAKRGIFRKNHYKAFTSFAAEGREQLNERAEWIKGHYETYRRFVHEVLAEVKNGRKPYGAFRGPDYKLGVDPNKDVKFFYVLIAGRTTDDLADSHGRHLADSYSVLDIQTETWDSWCNKILRG